MTDKPVEFRCPWCGKRYKTSRAFSDWEQRTLGLHGKEPEWKRMCNRCATRRLRNPYSGVLPMRRVS